MLVFIQIFQQVLPTLPRSAAQILLARALETRLLGLPAAVDSATILTFQNIRRTRSQLTNHHLTRTFRLQICGITLAVVILTLLPSEVKRPLIVLQSMAHSRELQVRLPHPQWQRAYLLC